MSTLCLGCMQPKENSPVCEHCGYAETQTNMPHQLPVGTLLNGKYLIGRVLGQGGFGITYMGWDRHLSMPVAIKEYFPGGVVQRHTQLGSDVLCVNGEAPELFVKHRERFLKEARTLAQLSDIPEIVQVSTFFSANSTAYIVMEYVQGITLKDHLKQLGRPMTAREALDIMEPVLKALQKVHDQGLIHRDISPDNIMLPKDGGIKLIDFGTVRYVGSSGASKSTESVLKPGFAPMEQYNTRGNLGTWTDVYALCATFHYLLTGRVPPEVMERVDRGESLSLLKTNETVSDNLIRTLEDGMRIRVPNRIQTVSELSRRLYTGAAPDPGTQKNAPASPGKLKGLLLAGAALGVLLIASGVAMLMRSPSTSAPDDRPVSVQASPETPSITAVTSADESTRYQQATVWAEERQFARAAVTFAGLGDYRDARERSFDLWAQVPNRKTVSYYDYHDPAEGRYIEMIHAIREDGSIAVDSTFSDSLADPDSYPTAGYGGIVSIHGIIGLRHDGTLALPAGDDRYAPLSGWKDITALAVWESQTDPSGQNLYVGLTTEGTLVYAASASFDLKELDNWKNITAIACGRSFVVGLTEDGTLEFTGHSKALKDTLKSWKGITAIAVSDDRVFGLTGSGTVIGADSDGNDVSPGWENIAVLADGPFGIRTDGSVVCGQEDRGNVSGWKNIVGIAGSSWQTAGLKADGTMVFTADGYDFYTNAKNWRNILLPDQVIADPQLQYARAGQLSEDGRFADAAVIYGKLGNYRDARELCFRAWGEVPQNQTVSAGSGCNAFVKKDGTVAFTAVRDNRQYGTNSWSDIVSVSAGHSSTVGLKADGTAVAVGTTLTSDWTDIIAIDASTTNTLGLRADGTVLCAAHAIAIGEVSTWQDIVAVSASSHAVGLKCDGTVAAAGSNQNGQCDVSQWEDIIAVSSASYNSTGITAGLKTDGTVVCTGSFGTIREEIALWKDIIAVETAVDGTSAFVAGLRSDGTVVVAGSEIGSAAAGWSDIVAISANSSYLLGLRSDGTVVSAGSSERGEHRVSQLSDIRLPG